MKRKFLIKNHELVDHYEHEQGTGCDVRAIPETLKPGDQPIKLLKKVVSVDVLLAALEEGDVGTPMRLLDFLNDERVLPALRKRLQVASISEYPNLAQALQMARDPDAVVFLQMALESLNKSEEWSNAGDDFDFLAFTATTIAEALLVIAPWTSAAGALLERLAHCSDPSIRQITARATCAIVMEGALTPVIRALRKQLVEALDDDDDDVFLEASPALVVTHWPQLSERVVALACGEDWIRRARAHRFLFKVPIPWGAQAIAVLLAWLPKEPSTRNQFALTANLMPLIDDDLKNQLIKRFLADRSPALRFDTIHQIFPQLDVQTAASYAKTALIDEPDPIIQGWLASYCCGPS
ncbi:MAG: hypothetical protein H0U74_17530 [Bradymonadaceae bacterium]|nr:hypothetical protein [Lujinxingiaceae bacterium]